MFFAAYPRKLLLIASVSVLVLSACGGGGSDPSTSPKATDLAQIQGTWKGTCDIESSGSTPVVNVGLSQESLVIGAPRADGSASVTSTTRYFNTGTSCSGAPIATITELPSTISSSGTTTASGLTAFKVSATSTAGTPTFSGAASIQNREGASCVEVIFGTAPNTSAICEEIETTSSTVKLLIAPTANGGAFDIGANAPLDAQGFPTALLPASEGRYTKQ
jgi:hypothetical protein